VSDVIITGSLGYETALWIQILQLFGVTLGTVFALFIPYLNKIKDPSKPSPPFDSAYYRNAVLGWIGAFGFIDQAIPKNNPVYLFMVAFAVGFLGKKGIMDALWPGGKKDG
jgi:hypothetical protein